MSAIDVINEKIKDRGMTIVAVSRKSGISADLLSRTLNHKRKLKADEFIKLCRVLELTLDNFKQNQKTG